MKKFLILLVLGFISFFSHAAKYEGVSVEVITENVNGSAYYVPGLSGAATEFEGFISNAGFVVTNEGVVVFDALGTPALAHIMLEQIRKVTDKPIKLVVVSHYHADHIYGLQVFKEEGAQIWAPKGAWEYLDSEAAPNLLNARRKSLYPWVNTNTYLVEPDLIINKDIQFELGGQKFLISYFGKVHSNGDMSLLSIDNQTLYSGDIIFEGRIPFVGDADIVKWIATLDRAMKMDMEYFVPGHGSASDQPQETMDLTYRYLKFLLANLTLAVDEMTPFDEAYNAIDWSEFADEVAFEAANRRNAYAVYLYLERTLD